MPQNRSYERLTLTGIAYHIINAILLWEKGKDKKTYGTQNDCQLVINFLIRKYHDRFEVEAPLATEYTPQAIEAKKRGERVVKEHAIPVACVMRELIARQCMASMGDIDLLLPQVEAVLKASAGRRYVSRDEDRALRGFIDTMPAGHECYPWPAPWIRHDMAGIPFKLKGTMDPQREAALVSNAGSSALTGTELATIYETLRREGGTQASLDALETRIRSQYPEVARKLGLK